MTQLEEFARDAAKRYLQNIVFVDDEIYSRSTGHPIVSTADLPVYQSPFVNAKGTAVNAVASVPAEEKIPYHPKHLVESFAREGMICALYEPAENFSADKDSELFKLCERADVVILDWDLFGRDGRNILPLIGNLVDESQNSVPHHARLCVIYTTKPDLERVGGAIYDHLKKGDLSVQEVTKPVALVAGATRIVVLGKPNVPGRTQESKALEVAEEKLAERVIDEFATMHGGILPSYALRGMAAVRRNSKKILDKFHSTLDAPFLVHRALLIADEDAFEQLPELLAEEVLAVMYDDQIPQERAIQLAKDVASSLPLQTLDWRPIQGRPARAPGELARLFVGGGQPAIAGDYKFKNEKIPSVHTALGCGESHAEKKLAALFNLRTRYFNSKSPTMGFGTIIRRQTMNDGGPVQDPIFDYGLCLMPLCDGMRLDHTDGKTTSFPFWSLKGGGKGVKGRGIVVFTKEQNYVELLASGKPRDMLWISQFAPSPSGTVTAVKEGASFWFDGEKKLEWVAQLKPAHAQRVAHDIGQTFSRVGVVEAEWLRLLTDK